MIQKLVYILNVAPARCIMNLCAQAGRVQSRKTARISLLDISIVTLLMIKISEGEQMNVHAPWSARLQQTRRLDATNLEPASAASESQKDRGWSARSALGVLLSASIWPSSAFFALGGSVCSIFASSSVAANVREHDELVRKATVADGCDQARSGRT